MGRRSRKRGDVTTRAQRDEARRERTARPRTRTGRPPSSERPKAPWGSFPLSELLILIGIVVLFWGLFSGEGGQERIAAGLVLASLGGGELALREHLGGFRSHSTLLAGVAAFLVVSVAVLALGTLEVWTILALGAGVFAGTFYAMRELFKRRSGGLGFR